MANKKTFDREKMYRKIMPTYYDNNFALATEPETELPDFDNPDVQVSDYDYETEVSEENDFSEYESDSTVVNFPVKNPEKKAIPAFPQLPFGGFDDDANPSLLRTAEIERLREQHNSVAIYNLTEKIIMEKLDVVMENMNCCRCDRCKMDVVALTLNNMNPHYIVRSNNSPDYSQLEKEISDQATKAVLKSAIKVRKNPRH